MPDRTGRRLPESRHLQTHGKPTKASVVACLFAETQGVNEVMKTSRKLALAVLASGAIGIAGGRAIHAWQVKAAPAFFVSEADEITDLDAIKKYGEKVPETLAPFNGHYHFVIGGGKTQNLEGEAPKGIVVIAFDSAEEARAWYDSPAYEAIKPIRQSAVKGRIFMVEGVAPK